MVRHRASERGRCQRGALRVSPPRRSSRPQGHKQAGKAAVPPMPKKESGVEVIGGKAIPWTRHGSEDYWTITYGSPNPSDHARRRKERIGGKLKTVHGTTLLVRHVRRGSSTWGCVYDGHHSMSTAFTNRLQGIIGTPDGSWLMSIVDTLQHKPFTMDDAKDPGRSWVLLCERIRQADGEEFNRIVAQYITWWKLLPFIADDIAHDTPRCTNMLARIIAAQSLREWEESLSKRIIEATLACAFRLDRVPTKSEVRAEYMRDPCVPYVSNSDFSKALTVAGFSWLPTRL
jgi:hypothetical protein